MLAHGAFLQWLPWQAAGLGLTTLQAEERALFAFPPLPGHDLNHTFMELIDSGKFFELYDKWFGERGVVPYPMSDRVRSYMIMQSMPE
jgi:hypothetical protein